MSADLVALLATLCLAGAFSGLTAGLFGNGGGFVVVPVLLSVFPLFGETHSNLIYVAIGTSLATIVISSARAVQAHRSSGAVDFDVLRTWAMWLVLGVVIGLGIAAHTEGKQLVSLFAAGVLIYSVYFLLPNLFTRLTRHFTMPTGAARAGLASFLGGFSALLGIGGGTITVMTMTLCNRSIHQAVGTAAGVGFIIGLPGAIGFMILGLHEPDLPIGSIGYVNFPALAAICSVSLFTAPVGARWAHSLDDRNLKRLFGVYLVIVSMAMFYKAAQA